MLPQPVVVSGGTRGKVLGGERRSDADIHGEAFGILPTREGDVPRPSSGSFAVAEDTPFFQYRRQETFVSHLGHQVSDSVVTNNDVSVLFTASGVIAV